MDQMIFDRAYDMAHIPGTMVFDRATRQTAIVSFDRLTDGHLSALASAIKPHIA